MSAHIAFCRPGTPDIALPTQAPRINGLSRPLVQPSQTPEGSVKVDPPEVVKRRSVAWAGMVVEIVQATRLRNFEIHSASSAHLLIAYEEGLRQEGETRVKGATTPALRNLKHKLTFVPASHEFNEWHTPAVQLVFTCFHIDPSERFGLADSRNLKPRVLFENPVLWDTAAKLRRLTESACEAHQHYTDAVAAVLCHELDQIISGHMTPNRPARGGLAAWQLRLVTEYIEKHLGEHVGWDMPRQVYLLRHSGGEQASHRPHFGPALYREAHHEQHSNHHASLTVCSRHSQIPCATRERGAPACASLAGQPRQRIG